MPHQVRGFLDSPWCKFGRAVVEGTLSSLHRETTFWGSPIWTRDKPLSPQLPSSELARVEADASLPSVPAQPGVADLKRLHGLVSKENSKSVSPFNAPKQINPNLGYRQITPSNVGTAKIIQKDSRSRLCPVEFQRRQRGQAAQALQLSSPV